MCSHKTNCDNYLHCTMDELINKNQEAVAKINLDGIEEILYWTRRFNCTESELRKVIKTVGNSVNIVEKFFV